MQKLLRDELKLRNVGYITICLAETLISSIYFAHCLWPWAAFYAIYPPLPFAALDLPVQSLPPTYHSTFDYGAKLGSPGDPPILLGALRIQVP